MRFSVRELIVLIAFFAFGIASLRAGGVLASITGFAGIVLIMALAITAFVGTGRLKSFSIGFILPLVVYAATVLLAKTNELDPYEGRLPTTQVLRYAHQVLVRKIWTDLKTGNVIPDFDITKNPNRPVALDEYPDRSTFMPLAHMLLAMLIGWIGGKFALYIHQRQKAERVNGEEQGV
jgi:hypothetical protein